MPGNNPTRPPEESAEDRDARVAADNELRDARRRMDLELAELRNAARVHLPRELVDEAARHGMEFALVEPADDAPRKGE